MATNVLTELDQQLASLNQLKPPGASKSKIQTITTLCVNNIQAESNLVQSLYRALKKAPATHKLGAIYVIDSVVRRWIEQAKLKGQELNIEGRGEPGTYPAAVKRVTELMPALFDDTMKGLPADQKEKLEGMVKIWEKAGTFPTKLLGEFREKLSGEANKAATQVNGAVSRQVEVSGKFAAPVPSRPLHTPTGYPPQHVYDQGFVPGHNAKAATPQQTQPMQAVAPSQAPPPPSQAPQDVNSILASLANLKPSAPYTPTQLPPQQAFAPQQQQPPPQAPQMPSNIAALFGQQGLSIPPPQQAPQYSTPQPQAPPFQLPQGFPTFPPQQPPSVAQPFPQAPPPPQQPQPAAPPADPLAPLRHILPANILNDQQKLVQALKLLQDLQKDGIPMDQWQPVLAAFAEQYQPPSQQPQPQHGNQSYGGGSNRSRSPDRGARGGRGSPVYGSYDGNQNGNANGNLRNRYRQRSPMRSPGGQNTELAMNGNPMQPKYIALDSSLPRDHIKVLSRTLFVGGASGTQKEIEDLFEQFGRVQTCISNSDKRHAFVKMTTRAYALAAKSGMEKLQSANDRYVMHVARQTKWGVGFGPRECCDYQRGESVIPISKLTEADMKWLLTAEYGGTGGRKVESGMVLEEPDIEIGAGVSSKAMSKRTGPEHTGNFNHQGHNNHGKRQRDHDNHHGGGGGRGHHGGRKEKRQQRYFEQMAHANNQQQQGGQGQQHGGGGHGGQQMEQYGYARPEPVAVATPPAVPGFGLPFPGSGGAF